MNDLQATSSYSGISILFKAQCLDLLQLLVGFSKLFKNPQCLIGYIRGFTSPI